MLTPDPRRLIGTNLIFFNFSTNLFLSSTAQWTSIILIRTAVADRDTKTLILQLQNFFGSLSIAKTCPSNDKLNWTFERRKKQKITGEINQTSTILGEWTARAAQPVQRLSTWSTIRVSNAGRGKIFGTLPDRPRSLCSGYRSAFLGSKTADTWR
jgi:hypothetical protein